LKQASGLFLVILGIVLGGATGSILVFVYLVPPPSRPALSLPPPAKHPKPQAKIAPGSRQSYPGAQPAPDAPIPLYLDVMKRSLTDAIYEDEPHALEAKKDGRDWPSRAYTMIGLQRLDNLQRLVEDVLASHVRGDLIECGAWRGGATIFMRSILKAHHVADRKVWVADSFEGLPPPTPGLYPADKGDYLHMFSALAVSVAEVQDHFASYGLLDSQVVFVKGLFKDALPKAKIERLAVLRVDGDMYESTMDALTILYDKVSVGGYVIVDDAGALESCRKAVEDFRSERHITAELKTIDWTGVYWQKQGTTTKQPGKP
jgi:O-methyltransferase